MARINTQLQALHVLCRGAPAVNVRRALRELHGMSIPDMARVLGVPGSAVTQNIQGFRSQQAIQHAIAELWGVPREKIFPDDPEE